MGKQGTLFGSRELSPRHSVNGAAILISNS